jgi:hypothetical protein
VTALIALILVIVAFIVRAVQGGGLEAEDWVLWFLAATAFHFVAPAVAYVETHRRG